MSAGKGKALIVVMAACAVVFSAGAAPKKPTHVDGSRTRAVHTTPLYNEFGEKIQHNFTRPDPFSPRMTCGDCHDYEKIGMGWHFNSSLDITAPGRPGEPWVLVDESTGTQLPLSYRGWPGTWNPEEAGLTPWEFTKRFARHMPGGDMGEKEEAIPDPKARWEVSGRLEINCLTCHSTYTKQNQSEWAFQIGRENFRWAATAASGLGIVDNVASRLRDTWDYYDGPNPDSSWAAVPEVDYDATLFDGKMCVFFDVTRDAPVNRCYFCHSTVSADADVEGLWKEDGDVHIAAGLLCTDCHRNGLDHSIVRGYEGESTDPKVVALTCQGCHLGEACADGLDTMGGRLGAPRPLHRGLPAVHLENLTCTACHSGMLPKADKAGRVRTARANRLGIHGKAQWDTELPYIMSPVFVKQDDGKIAPYQMMWPAFWGTLEGETVKPLPLEQVALVVNGIRQTEAAAKAAEEAEKAAAEAAALEAAEEAAEAAALEAAENAETAGADTATEDVAAEDTATDSTELEAAPVEEPELAEAPEIVPLRKDQIAQALADLAAAGDIEGTPVYVSGGKVYRAADGGGDLVASEHAAAAPYSWPLGHDVRPASQSLGAGGCTDCHSNKAGFFYAAVDAAGPLSTGVPAVSAMYELETLDRGLLKALEVVALAQPVLVVGGLLLACVLAAAVLHFGFSGLESFLRLLVPAGSEEKS